MQAKTEENTFTAGDVLGHKVGMGSLVDVTIRPSDNINLISVNLTVTDLPALVKKKEDVYSTTSDTLFQKVD